MLESKIESKSAEKGTLTEQIAALDSELLALEASKSKAKTIRDDGNKLFQAADKDYEATIQAIKDALAELEKTKAKTDSLLGVRRAQSLVRGVLAFLEMRANEKQKGTLHEFLEMSGDPVEAAGDMKEHVKKYKFKSSSVIELLKGLQEMFEEEKLAALKGETNAQNAYLLSEADLQNSIDAATKNKAEKEKVKADVEKDLSAATTEKTDEEEAKEASETSLEETKTACSTKESEWKTRSEIRAGEIEAIKAAIDILSKVSGVRSEAPENPILPAAPVETKATTFLQIAGTPKESSAKAVQLLKTAAKATHSKALERLAMAIAAKSDETYRNKGVFDQIINMIEKMIFKLQDDQTKEDTHKAWCDKELAKTAASISDKSDKVKDLTTEIDDMKATVVDLQLKISKDQELLTALAAHMDELKEVRAVGKKENAISIKDAEDAINSIAEATAVLEAFYKESGAIKKEAWEFVQVDPAVTLPATPATWDSSYTAVSKPENQPGGIMTVLATVSEHFSKMVADTKAQDAQDEETFKDESSKNVIETARLKQEVEMMTQQKRTLNNEVASTSGTRKNVQKALDTTKQYETDLQPACVEGDSSYDDRKAARNEEIEALRQAEAFLKTAFDEVPEKNATETTFLQIRRHVN